MTDPKDARIAILERALKDCHASNDDLDQLYRDRGRAVRRLAARISELEAEVDRLRAAAAPIAEWLSERSEPPDGLSGRTGVALPVVHCWHGDTKRQFGLSYMVTNADVDAFLDALAALGEGECDE